MTLAWSVAALAIRRNGAGYVLGGFVAFEAVEMCFHQRFGFRVVQGGPAHFAGMFAANLGVTLSALVESRAVGKSVIAKVNASGAVGRALNSLLAIRQHFGALAHAAIGVAAFAAAEVLIRVTFGLLYLLAGSGFRWHGLFFDGLTNYAIVSCAMAGVLLGWTIGRWSDHPRIAMHSVRIV